MTALTLVTIETLLRRAPRALPVLLVGAALLCAPARAQEAQLLEPDQARPEGADLLRPDRDAPPSAPPETGEVRPDPADITARDRGVAATVSLSLDPATVTESGGARTVTVTAALGGAAVAAEEVVVQLAIGGGGTAAGGVDHSVVAAIPPARIATGGSDAIVTFTLAPTDDDTVEADETVVVTGTAPGHTVAPATLTITDSDRATVGVSRGPLYLLHSERGRYFSFSVTLDAPVDAEVRVPWGVHAPASPDALTFTPPGGTQTVVQPSGAGPADVTPSSGMVTLGGRAGTAGSPITLEVVRDDLSEGYESVGVELGIPVVQPGAIADRVALASSPRAVVGHIGPSDPVTVSLSGPDTVDEGEAATYTVSVLGPDTPTAPLTVTVTAEGVSATNFEAPPAQVIITATGRSVTFTVFANADTDVEGDETLTVRISDPVGGGGGGTRLYSTQSSKETTIVDGDHSPVSVSFGADAAGVTRHGPSAVVTVTLSEPPGRTVEIPITESRATGVAPGDYGGVPDIVTLGPFATEATFMVTSGAEDVAPGDLVTLGFGPLPAGLSAGSAWSISQMTVSLVTLVGTITMALYDQSGDGPPHAVGPESNVTRQLKVWRSTPAPSSRSFRVFVSDRSTATERGDFILNPTPLRRVDDLPVDEHHSISQPIRMHLTRGWPKPHKTLVLTTSVPGYAVQPATMTIWDANLVNLTVTPVQIQGTYREGAVISFIPLLSSPVRAMITVDFSISVSGPGGGGDEFSPATVSHVFHGINDVRRRSREYHGINRSTWLYSGPLFHITVNDDNLSEGRQTIQFSLSSVSATPPLLDHRTPFESRIMASVQGPIPNSSMSIDPSDPVALSLSGPDTVAEGTAATYTVSVLPGGVHQDPVTVDISAEGAGAGDLSGTPMSVTIPVGTTTATFSVTAVADGADEGDETFTVTIGNPAGGGGGGFEEFVSRKETTILGTTGPARVTASFGEGFLTVVEGSVASVTVSLSAMPGRALDIPVTWRHEGGAGLFDHGEIAGAVGVGAGVTAGVLTVSAVADAADETGERVRLGFGDLPPGVVAGDPDRAVVLIADSAPSGIVRLGASPASVREGFDGDITVTAAVDGTPPASDLPVTLSEESAGGDHTLGTGVLPVVTVSAGESSVTATVRLAVPQDGVVEPGRAIVVTAAAQGHAVEPLSVAVVDDDRAVLDVGAYEDLARGIRLEVTLEGQVDGSVSVPWSAIGDGVDGNDVEPTGGTLVFAPNAGENRLFGGVRQAFEHVTVTVLDDHLPEGEENVRFRLGNPTVSPGGGEVADRIGFRRRQSDARSVTDPVLLSVTLTTLAPGEVTEGTILTYTVALQDSGERMTPVTVDLSTALVAQDGHDPAEADDFSSPPSVVIPVGATSATFTIATIDDMVREHVEIFGISITEARGDGDDGWIKDFGDGSKVRILDNDRVTVSFTEDGAWFFEQGDTWVVTVTITPSVERERFLIHVGGSFLSFFSASRSGLDFPPLVTQRVFTVTLDEPVGNIPSAYIGLGVGTTQAIGSPRSVTLVARVTNADPEFDAPTGTVTVTAAENLNVGDTVGDPLPVTNDDDPLVFSFVGDTPLFGFGPGGQITVAAMLDHEGQATHTVTVDVRDGRNSENRADSEVDDRLTVVVQVDDVNENPRFNSRDAVDSTLAFTVAENTAVPASLGVMPEATDPERDSFDYFFWDRSAESEWFGTVSGMSGPLTLDGRTLRLDRPPDHETDSDLLVTVGVSDFRDVRGGFRSCSGPRVPLGNCPNRVPPGSSLPFDRVTVSVTVTDVNEPPEFSGLPGNGTLFWSVDENSAAGTPVGSPVSVIDPEDGPLSYSLEEDDDPVTPPTIGLFGINGAGQVTVATGAELDHEAVASHTVVVAVSDGKDAGGGADSAVDARAAAVIAVGDVNEAPTFGDQSLSRTIPENIGVGVPVGAPVSATDPDRDTLAYALEEDDDLSTPPTAGLFGIDAAGQIMVSSGATLDDTVGPHTVVVAVSDGRGAAGGADSAVDARATVTITVVEPNGPPSFDGLSAGGTLSLSVDEGSATGTEVGGPVAVTDPETDPLSYSLGEDGDPGTPPATGLFGIDAATGQITVSSGDALDHESRMSHTVVVAVSDGKDVVGATDSSADISATVVIAVGDVDEPPGVPASLVAETLSIAQGGHTRLSVSWAVPAVTGTPPPITGYEVGYRTGAMDFTAFAHAGTALETTVTGLAPDTPYELRVRAVNAEGESDWVLATARTAMNAAPEFAAPAVTLMVAESAAVGAGIGAPVTAAANDLDDLAYNLGGTGATLFDIDNDGQVSVAGALDLETAESHTLTLTATDPFGVSDTLELVIAIGDVDEPPGMPASLAAETLSIAQGGHTRLSLEWAVPAVTGTPPPVTDYEVGYRTGAMDYTPFAHAGTALGTTVTGLAPDTPYELRVRAVNDEGKSAWVSATARTAMNAAPEFAASAVTLAVAESAAVGAMVGAPVTAAANDLDDLSYELGGADATLFDVGDDGQVSVAAALDFETAESHTLALTATDPFGGSDTLELVIEVSDVDEPPGVPTSLVVEVLSIAQGGHTRLSVSWAVPAVTGTPPPVTGYEVGYRTGAMDYTPFAHAGTALETTVTGLTPDTPYDLRVRAVNAEGESDWVPATARTAMNAAPGFAAPTVMLTVSESAAVGAAVGAPVTAVANDLDDLAYNLGGADAALFDIGDDGQVSVAAALDFETAESYTLALTATDPFGGSDTLELVIAVSDVDEPPGVPDSLVAETFAVEEGGHTRLSLVWAASSNTGPPLTYEVEHRETAGATDSGYTSDGDPGHDVTVAGTSATVAGLAPDTGHDLRVRAVNAEGESAWAETTGTTRANTEPEVTAEAVTLTVEENTAVGTNLGDPITVEVDDTDVLTYALAGAGATLFTIGADGQAKVAREINFEGLETDASVTMTTLSLGVTVSDPFGAQGTLGLVVVVTDVGGEMPEAPTLTVAGRGNSLSVGWQVPENAGPVTGYVIEYKERAAPDTDWVTVTVTATSATIRELEEETEYDVRVRALSDEGVGQWGQTDTAVDTGIGLRLLPRVAGDPAAEFRGDDALLIFYFTQFNGLLSRPSNVGLSRIVVRGLVRGGSLSDADADEIIAAAAALGAPGGIPDSHPANLYAADPFNNNDALLLFYSIQFGDLLTRPALVDLMEIVVNGVLPRGHGLDRDGMRALVQAGRNLGRTL